eukprot:scaffold8501_cov129-Cylindrotheca_fusiformis.AAC.1
MYISYTYSTGLPFGSSRVAHPLNKSDFLHLSKIANWSRSLFHAGPPTFAPTGWGGREAKNKNSVQLAVLLRDQCFDDARRMSSGCCSTSCTASGAPPPSLPLLCWGPWRVDCVDLLGGRPLRTELSREVEPVASRLRRLATTPN